MPPPAILRRVPESTPDSVSVVPLSGLMKPLARVTARPELKLVVVTRLLLDPLMVRLPEVSPRLASADTCRVPAETVVPPE